MEPLSKTDEIVLALVIGLVGLMVVVALRATKPGAPARMGAIVAGLMLLLTLIVGLRAHDVTAPRSKETPGVASSAVAAPLRPSAVDALDGAEFTGDPQSGLTIDATSGDATVRSVYLADAKICDGQADADLTQDAPTPETAIVSNTGSPTALAGTVGASPDPDASSPAVAGSPATSGPAPAGAATTDYGVVVAVRVPRDANSTDGLSVAYLPARNEVRLTSASGTTTVPVTGAPAAEAHLRAVLSGHMARVWLGNQLVTAVPVAVTGGCAAVRFGAWGAPATLRALTIRAS